MRLPLFRATPAAKRSGDALGGFSVELPRSVQGTSGAAVSVVPNGALRIPWTYSWAGTHWATLVILGPGPPC